MSAAKPPDEDPLHLATLIANCQFRRAALAHAEVIAGTEALVAGQQLQQRRCRYTETFQSYRHSMEELVEATGRGDRRAVRRAELAYDAAHDALLSATSTLARACQTAALAQLRYAEALAADVETACAHCETVCANLARNS